MKKNFLITTGGSGGHVIPATIIYKHLSNEANVLISSDKRGVKYLDKNIYQLEIINTPKLSNIFFLPINFFVILFLTLKSIFLLKSRKIEKVISTGGYMSLPIVLASKIMKLDIYLIEPNHVLGRANKFFLNFCKKIFCYSNQIKNFPKKFKEKIIMINPLVKEEVYNLNSQVKTKVKFNLLIVGGSQGADIFDYNLKNSIVNISKKIPIRVNQQTSKKNISYLKEFYSKNDIENWIFSFEKNFIEIVHKADLCITRAGASTLAELSVLNIPFVAVPLPTSKDNHQYENANFYRNKDCCWLIEQKNFDETIEEVLKNIFDDKSNYLQKKENLKKLNYQNTWINNHKKILRSINEN